MSRARRVALLYGGRSVEHEVSVDSARSVASAMREAGIECVPIGVTGDGRWLSPGVSRRVLEGDGRRAEPQADQDDAARVVLEPGSERIGVVSGDGTLSPVEVDAVFPLIHGWGGEDGRLQGALDLVGLPCVGAGVRGSSVGMDKVLARQLCDAQGLPSVRWMWFDTRSYRHAPERARERMAAELGFPMFVKPANGGSSVGVTKLAEPGGLEAAMDEAFQCDARVVVEQGVDAREIECAVLGNDAPEASILGEIVPSREFYDYAAKYLDGTSELKIPAPLEPDVAEAIRAHALTAFRCLDLGGLARVDFLLERGAGHVYLNEVNTLPGFTSISMFPRLWEASGLTYPDLVRRLVDLAIERWRAERAHRTAWQSG